MTFPTSMREIRVKPAVLKRSFILAERLARDGEAGAQEEHRCRAMDGYTTSSYTSDQASN
jgi:hypothetical protein